MPSLIFIDGGDPVETKKADEMLKSAGFDGVGGQTTNPSLIARNHDVMKRVIDGKKLTHDEALNEYKKIVTEIAKVTSGPVSIQVIADQNSKKEGMLRQAYIYKDWIPNGVVKFPATFEGLAAAEEFCQDWSVNITLNFSQEQAAAVYVATRKARHRVFISPFVGRLDDRGENGMEVVENILKMYHNAPVSHLNLRGGQEELFENQGSHIEVLTASVRKFDHIFYALQLGSAAITIPFKIFQQWADMGFSTPLDSYHYDPRALKPMPYREIPLDRDWRSYDLHHDLTDIGLTRFMEDWHSIAEVKQEV